MVDHARQFIDDGAIDETIGRLSRLDLQPQSASYLLTSLTGWPAERDIKIPALPASA